MRTPAADAAGARQDCDIVAKTLEIDRPTSLTSIETSKVSVGLFLAGIGLAVLALGLVANLVIFWGANSQYSDRALILLASGWLVCRYRGELPEPSGTIFGLIPLVVGLIAPLPAYTLAAQIGPRSILLWWLAGSLLLSAAGAILLVGGWRWLRKLAFPFFFVLFALPIPDRIEKPLQNRLQVATTIMAEHGLRAMGMTVHRQGFELHLPSGSLEVVEACSGVRSITALLAIATFVSHVRGFGLIRGALMLALALPVIATVNAFRIILTGLIQENFGQRWVQGTPHEILGTVMVLFGLALVLLLSQLLRSRSSTATAQPVLQKPFVGFRSTWISWPLAILLLTGGAASGYFYFTGMERSVHVVQLAPLEQLPTQINQWKSEDITIPDSIKAELTFDKAIWRSYQDPIGNQIDVWVIYWQANTAIRGYHHPDICFPNRGFNRIRTALHPIELVDGTVVPVTVRHFERDRERARVSYWTQEGTHVFTKEDETNASQGSPVEKWLLWLREWPSGTPPQTSARLSVLIRAEHRGRGDRSDRLLDEFTRNFAEELYRICIWAKPERVSELPP